ncbi:glutathione hydrolase 5 proenzyme-like [Archocentrus centrarchus]|uniref:glutathione hydrolase 5 proenzyme-like n=1 Tax=Archocentrus centrarchus TaxID=63155 RepID=UPI0011EA0356|nr:glutathione hydrolase 5 proenzyme-like [Archocentrus centrarchus]
MILNRLETQKPLNNVSPSFNKSENKKTAPLKVNPDLLKSCNTTFQVTEGNKWIGVPGEIQGYAEAHRRYGKLPWATLFEPTIRLLAREGFPIPYVQGLQIPRIANTSLRKLYSDENGNLLKIGDILKFEKLADTLEMIAKQGPDVFYNGSIAEDLIHDIQQAGGTLTLQDLASYKVTVTDAWTVPLGEYQMYFPPPPAGGAILSLILNIMKGYKMNSAPITTDEKILFYHRYVETLNIARGLKKHIRDPKFTSDEVTKKFTEESFADDKRRSINDEIHDPRHYNPTLHVDSSGTTHVSVLTEDGSAVSVTSSINYIFGSMVLSPSTGIILNNQLYDFCGRADSISPGERPPSNMAPAVLKSQLKTLVIGGSGGSWITTAMASVIMNHLWFGKSLKEAIDTPVVYVDSQYEAKFELRGEKDVVDALEAKGHKIAKPYNVVNAVEKDDGGCISACSDERKKGKAAGY